MNHNILRFLFIVILISIINPPGICQTDMPDVLQKGSLTEQLNYIEERTRIYDYYRAIREDMWQQIKKNTLDTLAVAKGEISVLTLSENKYNGKIDSLNKIVTDARVKLDEAVRTKNSINVLGLDINKFAYNSVMWIIVAGLAIILAIVFLAFKRNITVTRNTKKDLEELKAEFETYRKQSREAREKMSMEHFNEIRRLRGKGAERGAQGGGRRAEGTGQRAESEERRARSGERRAEGEEQRAEDEEQMVKSEDVKGSELSVKDSELRVKGEMQADQTEQAFQSSDESTEIQGDASPEIHREVKKPRKRKPQSPGQGSIEL